MAVWAGPPYQAKIPQDLTSDTGCSGGDIWAVKLVSSAPKDAQILTTEPRFSGFLQFLKLTRS